jgi:hypothetical protein
LNEQWPEYWAKRFGERGYVAMDCIRPRVWRDERVEWWYAQNAVLYAERQRVERDPQLEAARAATAFPPLSVVHPRKYLSLIDWLHLAREIQRDLAAVIPLGARLIFVDEDQIRDYVCPEALPFLEHAGQYCGPPEDDATALRELDRLRCGGATFIAFGQPAFWWLRRYREFHQHLRSRFPCPLENERLIVFDLRAGAGGAP